MNVKVKEKADLRFKDIKVPKATTIESPFQYEEICLLYNSLNFKNKKSLSRLFNKILTSFESLYIIR